MSEYMEKFSVQRLIGAPPGYVGYDEGGQLTEAVRRRPYSVILLDEMEKAHPDVFNVLLQVLDDGRLTDGQGRQVSFKNTIIIMTSNVGSKAIADLSGKDEEEMRHQVDGAMAQTFRPEFLNRIDDIVVFHPLGMAQIEKIVDIQLADVRARLAKERMTLAITPAAKQMLAVGGLDPVFGARPLKRLVQREVVDAIAAAIIDGTVREGDQVTVDVDKDGGFTVVCDNTPAATYEVPDASRFWAGFKTALIANAKGGGSNRVRALFRATIDGVEREYMARSYADDRQEQDEHAGDRCRTRRT